MGLFGDIGDRLKKAVTPPSTKNNILRAVAAPITGGLSLAAPEKLVDAVRTGVRYTGVYAQSAVAPVLPADVQRRIFGLSPSESKVGETVQKISRGVYAAAAVAAVGVKATAASAAARAVATPSGKAAAAPLQPPAQNFDPRVNWWNDQPKNYVELGSKTGAPAYLPAASPTNYVELTSPASASAAQKAVSATAEVGKKASEGATFLSNLKKKGYDVLETALVVGGVRAASGGARGDGSDGGGVSGVSAPAPSGGGSSINPSFTDAPTSSDGGDGNAQGMQLAVIVGVVAVAGGLFLLFRSKS